MHVMSSSPTMRVQNPYAVCAKAVGTTTGGKSCKYDWSSIHEAEVRAYAMYRARALMRCKDGLTRTALREMKIGALRRLLMQCMG